MKVDTHLMGSERGYGELSASTGLSASDCEAIFQVDIGQPAGGRADRLASQLVVICRRLPSDGIALTRCIPGPVDDVGRPTIQFRTMVMSVSEWVQSVRHALPWLLRSNAVWTDSSFDRGMRLTLDVPSSSPATPTRSAWVLGCMVAAGPRPVLLKGDAASEDAMLILLAGVSDEDAAHLQWGLGLGRRVPSLDVATIGIGASVPGADVRSINEVSMQSYGSEAVLALPSLRGGDMAEQSFKQQPSVSSRRPDGDRAAMPWSSLLGAVLLAAVIIFIFSILPNWMSSSPVPPAEVASQTEPAIEGGPKPVPDSVGTPGNEEPEEENVSLPVTKSNDAEAANDAAPATQEAVKPTPPDNSVAEVDPVVVKEEVPMVELVPAHEAASNPAAASAPELIVLHDPANVLVQLQKLYASLIDDPTFLPNRPEGAKVQTGVGIGVRDILHLLGSDTPSEVDEARADLCNSIEATRPLDDVEALVNPEAIAGWGSPEATEAWMAQRRGVSTEDFSSERKERLSNIEGCLSELRGLRHVVQGLQKHWVDSPRKGMGLHEALVEVQSSFLAKQEALLPDVLYAQDELKKAKAKEEQDVGRITQLESEITTLQEDAARAMSYEAVLSGFGNESPELRWPIGAAIDALNESRHLLKTDPIESPNRGL
jgi:hypothetical protein